MKTSDLHKKKTIPQKYSSFFSSVYHLQSCGNNLSTYFYLSSSQHDRLYQQSLQHVENKAVHKMQVTDLNIYVNM